MRDPQKATPGGSGQADAEDTKENAGIVTQHATRVQLSRRAGWRMPAGTVKVARPTKWGNPFAVAGHGRAHAVHLYRGWLTGMLAAGHLDPAELRGKSLACWCRLDQECHADVLLELANASEGKP
ncbi:MAG: DUF4326 domain-containing protein [Rubrivivax sp.]|nr:DUF4326 domain-containing protein [Rubrivivax sp.]